MNSIRNILTQQKWKLARIVTMSLRRSARVQVKPAPDLPAAILLPKTKAAPSKKRSLKSTSQPETESLATAAIAQDGTNEDQTTEHMPPPSTPNKRIKLSKPTDLPPVTPTPAAIGLMTSSSATKATPQPPATRLVKPHHTNATLITPGGTGLYSDFDEEGGVGDISPTKGGPATNKTLLAKANAHLLAVDPSLGPVIEKHYCKVFSPEGLEEKIDPFRSLASGIIAQQVSGAAARSIKNKFVGLFEEEKCVNGFPAPKAVVEKDMSVLRSAGLSQRKAEYIQGLAEKFENGELSVKKLLEGSDEEVMTDLVAVRGLGRWSVEMFMCFGLKRLDVFSTGDLGVQRGMAAHVGRDVGKLKAKGGGKWKYMSEKDMLDISAKFEPYR